MNPSGRRADLLTEEVGDEVVLYDTQTHEAHRLNPTAALVWRLADGRRPVNEIAGRLRERFAGDDQPDADDAEALVGVALDELRRAGLVRLDGVAPGEALSRRDMLKVAAWLVPVVATLMVPKPAMAASPFSTCQDAQGHYGNGLFTATATQTSSSGTCVAQPFTDAGTIEFLCDTSSGVVTMTIHATTSNRVTPYTVTIGGAGDISGSATSGAPPGCGLASASVTGSVSGDSASGTITLDETYTLSGCCTETATYHWTGSY